MRLYMREMYHVWRNGRIFDDFFYWIKETSFFLSCYYYKEIKRFELNIKYVGRFIYSSIDSGDFLLYQRNK